MSRTAARTTAVAAAEKTTAAPRTDRRRVCAHHNRRYEGGTARIAFLERTRVALSAGAAFGTGGAGQVRLNYAASQEVPRVLMRRMGSVSTA